MQQQAQQNETLNRYADESDRQKKLVSELSEGKEGPRTERDYEPKEGKA